MDKLKTMEEQIKVRHNTLEYAALEVVKCYILFRHTGWFGPLPANLNVKFWDKDYNNEQHYSIGRVLLAERLNIPKEYILGKTINKVPVDFKLDKTIELPYAGQVHFQIELDQKKNTRTLLVDCPLCSQTVEWLDYGHHINRVHLVYKCVVCKREMPMDEMYQHRCHESYVSHATAKKHNYVLHRSKKKRKKRKIRYIK